MINFDILIKTCRKRGHTKDWPKYVRAMWKRLGDIKLGFPGINNKHLDLVEFNSIKQDDLFIWDLYLDTVNPNDIGDEAPLLLRLVEDNSAIIEGIGYGIDSIRDPDRLKYRWMDKINININSQSLVYKYIAKPDLYNGGPSYYYWFKAYRDNRY